MWNSNILEALQIRQGRARFAQTGTTLGLSHAEGVILTLSDSCQYQPGPAGVSMRQTVCQVLALCSLPLSHS